MSSDRIAWGLILILATGAAHTQEQCGFPPSILKSGFEDGEQAPSVELPPDTTPIAVTFQGPADGSTVGVNAIQFYGTYTGPANTGIAVNGVPALTNGTAFVAPRIPLATGANTITLSYAATDTAPVTVTRTITYDPSLTQNVLLAARSPGDYAPTRVPFVLATKLPAGQTSVSRVQIDFNGDGTFDFDQASPGTLEYAYDQPGLYVALARVSFDDGSAGTPLVVVDDSTRVLVQSLAYTRQTLCRLYAAMKTRLAQQNVSTATNTLSTRIKPTYLTFWTNLQNAGQLVSTTAKLGPVIDGQLSRNSAEMLIGVPTANPQEMRGYPFRFRRDANGVWRIDGM